MFVDPLFWFALEQTWSANNLPQVNNLLQGCRLMLQLTLPKSPITLTETYRSIHFCYLCEDLNSFYCFWLHWKMWSFVYVQNPEFYDYLRKSYYFFYFKSFTVYVVIGLRHSDRVYLHVRSINFSICLCHYEEQSLFLHNWSTLNK